MPAKRTFSLGTLQGAEKLASASSTSNWWSTLKESVLEVGSPIPPLQSDGGALVSVPAGRLLY